MFIDLSFKKFGWWGNNIWYYGLGYAVVRSGHFVVQCIANETKGIKLELCLVDFNKGLVDLFSNQV